LKSFRSFGYGGYGGGKIKMPVFDDFKRKGKKKKKTKIYADFGFGFGRAVKERRAVWSILPDLWSVNVTEFRTGREATIPKATMGVRKSFYNALQGRGTGFVPTEEIRTGRVRL
jgi:hypothetical protein